MIFHAEDGIRDRNVTGVQTCALPICHLTLLDNVLLPGLLARNEPRAVLRSRAGEVLERLDVGELADHGVGEASGGQLQRVAIARALINRPRLLVADEPTGALDSAASDEVMGALADLHAEGMTIVLVTHDPGVAAGPTGACGWSTGGSPRGRLRRRSP